MNLISIVFGAVGTYIFINVQKKAKKAKQEYDINEWYVSDDRNTWTLGTKGKYKYKGEWKNDIPHGNGIMEIAKDKTTIIGSFVNGYIDGKGKQLFEQTTEETQPYYEGEFACGVHHGYGTYDYGDGSYYKGKFANSKFHGKAEIYSSKYNTLYIGSYSNDKRIGKGILYTDGVPEEVEY